MKKIVLLCILLICFLCAFCACSFENDYEDQNTVENDYENSTGEIVAKGEHDGHNIVHVEAVAATCTKEGNIEYWHCDECDKNYSDRYYIWAVDSVVTPLISHSLKYVVKEATCTEDGISKHYECKICNKCFEDIYGKSEIIPETIKAGHKWSDATCTKAKKCSVCGIEDGEPLDHEGIGQCKYCKKLFDGWMGEGHYLVGRDIEEGEYFVCCISASAYFEVESDDSGSLYSIICNENITSYTYVTVSDGQYLKIKRAIFTKADFENNPYLAQTAGEPYGVGTYKIGKDIPAGEYCVCAVSGSGYYEVSSNSDHILSSIVANDSFRNNAYITVRDGQYLTINRSVLYAVEDAPIFAPVDGNAYQDGMFKVGRDVAAGEYEVVSNGGRCYIAVCSNSDGVLSSIIMNESFTTNLFVTLKEGQYITISGGEMREVSFNE